ncbi:hypothetical protein P4S83_06925 [Aneurinibacillus thermoaerophilus]|jgi:hypothetical protein|uniref:hypothetical protein n=1 Tax=Aneurinibacillus thermoaerophilus TaxID=143495 RepID=UPI002E1C9CB0|nr:hypothetical protein [Aneurinibacillus thermoaerophilus]MED0764166.1 hypothetical protein [Aneurinibacillus thermoaerophilus]
MKLVQIRTTKGYDKILPQHGMVIKETENDIYLLFPDGRCKVSREEFNKFCSDI